MTEGVCVSYESGFVSYSNHAFDAMFGYQHEERVGKSLPELEDSSDSESVMGFQEKIAQLTAKGRWREKNRCGKRDGTFFNAKVRGTVLDLFGKISLILVWEDIAAPKQAQKGLSESEPRLRVIFEGATDLIFIKDRSFNYTQVNPGSEELLGTPTARFLVPPDGVTVIHTPPLRDRLEDLSALIDEIHGRLGKDLEITKLPKIQPRTMEALKHYNWPGNVRALRNVLERTLILGTPPRLEPQQSVSFSY